MRWFLSLLLLAGVVTGVLFLGSTDEGGVRPQSRPVGEASPPVEEPLSRAGIEQGLDEGRELAGAPFDSGPSAPVETEPDGRSLAGRLVGQAEGLPVPGLPLILRDRRTRAVYARVVTDGEGRFVSPTLPLLDVVVVHDVPEGQAGRWVLPALVAMVPGEGPQEVQLEVRDPAFVLTVLVVEEDGTPVPGAEVLIGFLQRDPDSGRDMSTGGAVRTDGEGRAHLGMWQREGNSKAQLFARKGERVSPFVEIGDPTRVGEPRLVLGAAARLELMASWPFGGPAAGRRVRLVSPMRYSAAQDLPWIRPSHTDDRGRASFAPLNPGSYEVRIENPRVGYLETVATEVVLAPGEVRPLEVTLSEGRRRIAAAGRVVDEDGEPLAGLDVHGIGGRWPEECRTAADGTFELWMEPIDRVRVALDVDPEGAPFDPGSLEVAFGTRGLEFRRLTEPATQRFRIEATDPEGAPIAGLIATFDRGPGSEAWSNSYGVHEVYERTVYPGLRCRAGARGYVSVAFDVPTELDGSDEDPPTVHLVLEPGLRHAARVLHSDDGTPLVGAIFENAEGLRFVSDVEGRVFLEASTWSVFQVRAEGFSEREWEPEERVLFDYGPVYLEPL